MEPKDVSRELRRIASRIDASSSPSRSMVARDIVAVIEKVAGFSPLQVMEAAQALGLEVDTKKGWVGVTGGLMVPLADGKILMIQVKDR